jgi:radical SAM protein with 4Fe4S-binding SPASM domain
MNAHVPAVVSWNITQACNLRCPHCYLAAGSPPPRELSTEEGFQLIEQLRELGTELLILTGGEPLARRDLCALARRASGAGLLVVLGTNATLIDEKRARALKASGVRGVGISLDSLDPAKHDAFRGQQGAWQKTVRAIELCQNQEIEVAIQTSVLPMNYDEILELIEFAYRKGARAFNAYFLVCTGRAEKLTDITPQQYEDLLHTLVNAAARHPGMLVRAKCAPHVKRLAYLQQSAHPKNANGSDASPIGLLASVGCPVGTSYLRINPTGNVTPCPYLPLMLGNVRQTPLRQIWQESETLRKLRTLELEGRCGICEFKALCVGCRARAFALTGNLLGEDPWCTYQSTGHRNTGDSLTVTWTDEALARIEKAPPFVRERIKQGAEICARARGLSQITPELLTELRNSFAHRKTATISEKSSEERHYV